MYKMYILVKENIPLGFKAVAISHTSLCTYLKFKDDQETKEWLEKSFRKVIVEVSEEEFEKAKMFDNHVVITESALDNKEIAFLFRPMEKIPSFFKMLKLFGS